MNLKPFPSLWLQISGTETQYFVWQILQHISLLSSFSHSHHLSTCVFLFTAGVVLNLRNSITRTKTQQSYEIIFHKFLSIELIAR